MKKLLFTIACALASFGSAAQLVGPQPWLFTGPQITIGGSKLVFDAPLTTSIVPRRGDSPTFPRATTATVFDHDGILRTAKSGEARFEGARRVENLLLNTEDFTLWTKGVGSGGLPTVLADQTANPNGLLLADYIIPANGSGSSNIYQNPVFVAGVEYSASVYLKSGGWSWVALETRGYSGDISFAWFDLSTGTVGTVQPGLTATISSVGNGWYRCNVVRTMGANVSSTRFRIYPTNADNAFTTGDGINGIYAWGGSVVEGLHSEYVSNGVLSSPYHGAGVDGVKYFDTGVSGTPISDSLLNGYLSEGQRTNYALYSRDFTNAAWVKTNVTAALDQTGIDSRVSSASKLTASAGNGTALQSITRASAQRVTSFYVKRVTGTGTVEITQDNGTTWTAITGLINGTTYTRVAVAAQTTANPVIGFRIVTSGDAIAVDAAQHEEAGFISSPIPTTSASVPRNADDPALTPWAGFDTEGAAYLEFTPSTTWANSAGSYGLGVAGADRGPIKLSGSNSGVQALDGTNTASGPAGTPSGRMKLACRWGAGKMRCFANNGAGAEANYDGSWNASELEIGRGNSLNAFGTTRNVKAWKRAPADAYLQGLTQ